jgi:hypothetical protein
MTAEISVEMTAEYVPTTQPEMLPILRELSAREPIFYRPEFTPTRADFEHMMADDYWEFGASGQSYSRDFILRALETRPEDATEAGWQTSNFHCRRLDTDTYLLTYTLLQGLRKTRRATIWRNTDAGWKILFHQGTLVRDF